MGKTLIIKGADFAKVRISLEIPLTAEKIQTGKLINPDLQVGDTVDYLESRFTAKYSVYSVPVAYTDAIYKFVGDTNYGPGTSTDYCIFALVLGSDGVIVGVVYANKNDGVTTTADTYEIDISKYSDPASILFCNDHDVAVAVEEVASWDQ